MRISVCCAIAILGFLGTGTAHAEPTALRAQLQSFRFTSDHGLLPRDGSRIDAAISHTAGDHVHIRAELSLGASGIESDTPFELKGTSAEPALCFQGEGKRTTENVTVEVAAKHPLGPAARKIEARIDWELTLRRPDRLPERVSLGSTGPHVVYVTLGTPRNNDRPAGTVTEGRLELAVTRVAAAQKAAGLGASGPRLVYELMKQNGEHYLPTRHYRGAEAWRVPESWAMDPPGASCIAIVEFVKLLCDMTGLDGEARVSACCARAEDPTAAVRGGLGDPPQFKPGPNGTTLQLFLIDHRNSRQGQVGGVGGVNYYEAVLEYDWHGQRYYLPGGTDRVFDAPGLVLQVFHTLAWAEYDERRGDWVVREVVCTYVRPGERFPPSVRLP